MATARAFSKKRPILGKARSKPQATSTKAPARKRMFTYRGISIKPSFVDDERSRQLEEAMREFGVRMNVLAD